MSKPAVVAMYAVVLALAGCAPGVTSPALGEQPRASEPAAQSKPAKKEVVVVEKSQPDEHFASQLRSQQSEIAKLRDQLDASRGRSDAAEAAARAAQTQVNNLQTELTNLNARVDTAAAQSEKAFQISTEFLSNLVAAREEQRSQIERNLRTFDAMDQRLKNIESLMAETRKQRESDAAASRQNYSATEQRLQRADHELAQLREQLTVVSRENKEMRSAIDSGAMMTMLRDMEAMRRDSSQLRGAVEEVQRQQEAARKRLQDYYLDLDARIQALQDKQAAAHKSGAIGNGSPADMNAPAQELKQASPSSVGVPGSSPESGSLPPLEIAPYGTGKENAEPAGATSGNATDSERNAGTQQNSAAPSANRSEQSQSGTQGKPQSPPVAAQGQFTTDWGTDTSSPSGAPAEPAQ